MSTDFDAKSSPLVLIVDDDKSMRILLRLVLEEDGYRIAEAHNGEACLIAYEYYKPDAVLLDAVMPVMDGFTCCSQLRKLAKKNESLFLNVETAQEHLPILMITVLDDPDSVDRAFEVGATDYITKPIHWAVLRHRVRRLLRYSMQQRYVHELKQQLETANQELQRLTNPDKNE